MSNYQKTRRPEVPMCNLRRVRQDCLVSSVGFVGVDFVPLRDLGLAQSEGFKEEQP